MAEKIDLTTVIARLNRADNLLILCHKNPDGDTLGSAAALYWALRAQGKTAAAFCADPVHEQYAYLGLELFYEQFTPEYVVAVDIAGTQLFGERAAKWADKVDLCIDHHGSNNGYAKELYLDAGAGSTCEIIFDMLVEMGTDIDKRIAGCLYTGVSTDTGCFRFANTTARTHRVAARLIDLGADIIMLNEVLFENKTKQRIAIEQMALSTLEYHFDGCCALICLTREMIANVGADEADLEGITSLPRSIEGVLVGITMRQQPGGSYKVSIRTKVGLDATQVARGLGGGGHTQAAGAEIIGAVDLAKKAVLDEVEKLLSEHQPCPQRNDAPPAPPKG